MSYVQNPKPKNIATTLLNYFFNTSKHGTIKPPTNPTKNNQGHLNLIKFFILTVVVATPITSFAQQDDGKIRVSVEHTGENSVGKQFAYAIREALRASNGFRLGSVDDSGLNILIVTVDPDPRSQLGNYWTAAAITYTMKNFIPYQKGNPQTWYPIYLTSQVMVVGAQRVDEQAKSVMAALDSQLERYRRDLKQ